MHRMIGLGCVVALAGASAVTGVASEAATGCLLGDPSGDQIAVVQAGDIWIMHGDGSGARRVTTGARAGRPTWSPDGTRLAYASARAGDFDIYVVHTDGTGDTNITHDPNTADLAPAWSPDGSRLAFHSVGVSPIAGTDTLHPSDYEIFAIDPDGSHRVNLTHRPPATGEIGDRAAADVKPSWSPDGRQLAFESYRGIANSDLVNSELWVMNADGTSPRPLTSTSTADEWFPAWSPDGSAIGYMTADQGSNFAVWTMDVDGTRAVRLTRDMKTSAMPTWSPDGRRIAFVSDRSEGGIDFFALGVQWNQRLDGGDVTTDDFDVYTMNRDGSCPTRLTNTGTSVAAAFWIPHPDLAPVDPGPTPTRPDMARCRHGADHGCRRRHHRTGG